MTRVLPSRKHNNGTRPGLTGVGPLGAAEDDEIQWEFKKDLELTEKDKRRVVSEVMRLGVEIMYGTHIYTFGGKHYKQREGGPIGLHSTCVLAIVVMTRWDCKWKERMGENNLRVDEDGRMVDDAKNFMYPVRPGWRRQDGGLWFSKECEREDELLSPIERTKRSPTSWAVPCNPLQ